MTKFSIQKTFRFEACHRLVEPYLGKCNSLHGHSFSITVRIDRENVDERGFVMDFSDLKSLKEWIENNLDHATLVSSKDETLIRWLIANRQKYYRLSPNPTSECLAREIFLQAVGLGFRPTAVKVNETCTSSALYREVHDTYDLDITL